MTKLSWKTAAAASVVAAVISGALPAAAQTPIKIGASLSLTGTYAKLGSYQKEGYELFSAMIHTIQVNTARKVFRVQIQRPEAELPAMQAKQRKMVEQAQTARQQHPDFDQVLDRLSSLYTAPALDACVHESDLGAELAYYLAQHPDEITRLNQVAQTAPLAMAREVGKLEMRLSPPTNGTTSRPHTPTPKPAPPTPLSGAGSPGPRLLTDLSNEEVEAMSQAEFEAAYKRQFPRSR